MNTWIDRDGCIACGLCADICPEVFRMSEEDDLAEVYVEEISEDYEDAVQEAAESCPVSVIHVEED